MYRTTFRSRIVSTCGACEEGVDVEDGVDDVEDAAAVARLMMAFIRRSRSSCSARFVSTFTLVLNCKVVSRFSHDLWISRLNRIL